MTASYANMIFDCRELLKQIESPPIRHNYREANWVIDALAKEGAKLTNENSFLCLKVPFVFISRKLEIDKSRTFFVRSKWPKSICNSSSTNLPKQATPMYWCILNNIFPLWFNQKKKKHKLIKWISIVINILGKKLKWGWGFLGWMEKTKGRVVNATISKRSFRLVFVGFGRNRVRLYCWICVLSHHHTSHGSPMVKAMPDAGDSSITMTTLTTANILLSKEGTLLLIAFVMLLLILLFIIIACKYKPWRFFYSSHVSSNSALRNKNSIKVRFFFFFFLLKCKLGCWGFAYSLWITSKWWYLCNLVIGFWFLFMPDPEVPIMVRCEQDWFFSCFGLNLLGFM